MNMTNADRYVAEQRPNHEVGYKALLVREEKKQKLRALRSSLSDRDLNQERRLATAALEMMLDDANGNPAVLQRWECAVREVARLDSEMEPHSIGSCSAANSQSSSFEFGYKPLLVREETKNRLRDLRTTLSDIKLNQERRLATAALTLVMEDAAADPSVMDRWEKVVREVVQWDLDLLDRQKN